MNEYEALEELELRYKVKESVYDKWLINTIKQSLKDKDNKLNVIREIVNMKTYAENVHKQNTGLHKQLDKIKEVLK